MRKEALLIAEEYSARERDVYLEAAQKLRMPYFDWTSEVSAAQGKHIALAFVYGTNRNLSVNPNSAKEQLVGSMHQRWCSVLAGIPEYILQKNVTVNTPAGRKSMQNPLESFVLPEDVAEGNVASARNVSAFCSNPLLQGPLGPLLRTRC